MTRAVVTPNSETVVAEMGMTPDQLRVVLKSAAKQSSDLLTTQEREQLSSLIGQVRELASGGLTVLQQRKTRVKKEQESLIDQKSKIGQSSNIIDDFFRLMNIKRNGSASLVASVPGAMATVGVVRSLIDRKNNEIIEIQYRINLTNIQLDIITQDVKEGQQALADLDRINNALR